MSERKYLPTFAELIDRLSIVQIKEVLIPDHRAEYAKEIQDIVHDIGLIVEENNIKLSADDIRTVIALAQMNLHIWKNEENCRKGTGDGNLALTHSINGVRNTAKNKLQELVGGRKDYKIDCLAATHCHYQPSGWITENKTVDKNVDTFRCVNAVAATYDPKMGAAAPGWNPQHVTMATTAGATVLPPTIHQVK